MPIQDRNVPDSEGAVTKLVVQLERDLNRGKNVALHCRQGVGRTGLIAACVLLAEGFETAQVLETLSARVEWTCRRRWSSAGGLSVTRTHWQQPDALPRDIVEAGHDLGDL